MVPAAAVNDDGNDFCVNWMKTGIKYILYFVVTLCSFIIAKLSIRKPGSFHHANIQITNRHQIVDSVY